MTSVGVNNLWSIPRGLELICVGLMLIIIPGGVAQSQQQLPCCVDRWDPEWIERDKWGPGEIGPGRKQRMTRHWAFIHGGMPPEYRGMWNPMAETSDVVRAGRQLYEQKCGVCHGIQGMGDGEAAYSLTPSPALLAYMIQMPMSVDEYLMWSIADGGEQFGTNMPAFKDTLTNEQIWTIIAYMRAGFPSHDEP